MPGTKCYFDMDRGIALVLGSHGYIIYATALLLDCFSLRETATTQMLHSTIKKEKIPNNSFASFILNLLYNLKDFLFKFVSFFFVN